MNQNTGFLRPDPDLTITVPGTAKKAITVGAYNIWLDDYADFSGRGYMGAFASVKPELSAPGVDITTTLGGRRLYCGFRDILCCAFCDRGGSTADGIWHCEKK